MKKLKHIITCILVVVISVCLLSTSVLAAWQNDLGYWYVRSGYAQMVVGGVLGVIGAAAGTAAGSIVLPGGGTISGTFIGTSLARCASLGIYKLAEYYAQGYTDDDYYNSEASSVNGMSRQDVLAKYDITGFSAGSCLTTQQMTKTSSLYHLASSGYQNTLNLLKNIGVNSQVIVVGVSPTTLYGYYWDHEGALVSGTFVNPFGSVIPSAIGVYSLSQLEPVNSQQVTFVGNSTGYLMFYSEAYAFSHPSFETMNAAYMDFDTKPYSQSATVYLYGYYKSSSSLQFSTKSIALRHGNTLSPDAKTYAGISISWDNSRIVVAAPEATVETRPSSLMQAIHNYNIDNSYTDNSQTVNYFIVPSDQTPSADNVTSPSFFNEETWIFTEPATGAQYQTTGWSYDYNTRTYDINLDSATFFINDTDVRRIVSTYGNELVTIQYYDASGNLLAADEYNYVMMAGSNCALDGHKYNAETTKDPTCNAAGERTYTCSVCGDQYVEEISKTDHVYADHTTIQAPTCTVGGIESKTCRTCGDQITEKIDPLGHDWIAKETNETTYELPPGTSCPSCSGTNYTFTRSGVIYMVTCSDCNTDWTAEADVTYGSTTYMCSLCNETKIEGDSTEETQQTWFTKFIYKFKWLSSIGQIYRQLVADITSDAATAAAIADGTVTLDEVTTDHASFGGGSSGSEGSGRQYTAPELAISFGNSDYFGVDWDAIKPLDLSWYAPHKETVDGIVSGILWLGFLFLLIKRAPSIIQGGEMITEDRVKIERWNNGIRSFRRH